MNSFNVYGQTEKKVGGNTPVWLGTVKPIPVGAIYQKGVDACAGTPVEYDPTTKEIRTVGDLEYSNAYLYNDIYYDDTDYTAGTNYATAAVVMYHAEGLLIERVLPEITEEQIAALQAKIPGVLLVRG